MKRATIADVARAAGVGVATVDRLLNGRGGVSAETTRRVLAAAEAVGYHAAPLMRYRAAETLPRGVFGFVLQKRDDVFYRSIAAELGAAVARAPGLRGESVIEFVDKIDPAAIAAALRRVGAGFRSYFRERGGAHRLLETAINLDDPEVAYAATTYLLDTHADLIGLYDAGGGREGIIAALRERGAGRDIAVVCDEVTPVTREALIDGTITLAFALPMRNFAATVVEELTAPSPARRGAVKRILPFDIYMQENVMAYPLQGPC